MATIYDAIKGEIQTSDEYLADDPFYKAGQLAQAQMVQPQTSSQAVWGPMVQALVGGVLSGIGKRRARETEFDAYKASGLQEAMAAQLTGTEGTEGFGPVASGDVYGKNIPILNSVYMQEDAPKGWTGATGKKDLLKAVMLQEAQAEEAKAQRESARKLADVLAQETALGPIKAENAKLLKQQEALAAITGATTLNPALKAINNLPEKMQAPALKELDSVKKFNELAPSLDKMMDEAFQATRSMKSVEGAFIPSGITDEQTTRKVAGARVFSIANAMLAGVLTNQDAERAVDPFLPTIWDSEKALAEKKKGLKEFIKNSVTSAPIIEGAGILERQSTSAGSDSPIPPGMKRLRNPKTGEVKDVPING